MPLHEYDYVVIGAGFAGLSYALKRLVRDPGARVLVLETNAYAGGRTHMDSSFAGSLLPTGASVGRLGKDRKLLALLKRYSIPHRIIPEGATHYRVPNHVDVKETYDLLLKSRKDAEAEGGIGIGMSFKAFGIKVLGKAKYEAFATSVGYTDYEQADAGYSLEKYGFDDTFEFSGAKFAFSWNDAIEALAADVTRRGGRIKYRERVERVSGMWCLTAGAGGREYTALKRIVIATPAEAARCVLDEHHLSKCRATLDAVGTNPFLRIYAQLKDDDKAAAEFARAFPHMTVVPRPFQTVIPIDPKKRLYLIAYSDNASAIELKDLTHTQLEARFRDATGVHIRISRIKKFFWKCGTHYFKPGAPLPLRKRFGAIELLGEAYSDNQGWTEGAL